jgi:hypothetical protein
MQPDAKKLLLAAVTAIDGAVQIVWAAALSYPLALVVIGISRSLGQI